MKLYGFGSDLVLAAKGYDSMQVPMNVVELLIGQAEAD
jgi:hypothetical protein